MPKQSEEALCVTCQCPGDDSIGHFVAALNEDHPFKAAEEALCVTCGEGEFNGLHPLTDALRYEVNVLGKTMPGAPDMHPFKAAEEAPVASMDTPVPLCWCGEPERMEIHHGGHGFDEETDPFILAKRADPASTPADIERYNEALRFALDLMRRGEASEEMTRLVREIAGALMLEHSPDVPQSDPVEAARRRTLNAVVSEYGVDEIRTRLDAFETAVVDRERTLHQPLQRRYDEIAAAERRRDDKTPDIEDASTALWDYIAVTLGITGTASYEPRFLFARLNAAYWKQVEAAEAALEAEKARTKALAEAGEELKYWLDCYTDITDMRSDSSRAVKEWDDAVAVQPTDGTEPADA